MHLLVMNYRATIRVMEMFLPEIVAAWFLPEGGKNWEKTVCFHGKPDWQ